LTLNYRVLNATVHSGTTSDEHSTMQHNKTAIIGDMTIVCINTKNERISSHK